MSIRAAKPVLDRMPASQSIRHYAANYLRDGIAALDVPDTPHAKYFHEPVKWGMDVLGERYTPDVKRVMEEFSHNSVVFAQSANAVGKTHAAARLVFWGFSTRKDIQIYLAAAPPEDNLRDLLFGEIGSILERHPYLVAGCSKVSLASMFVKRSAKSFIRGVTIPSTGTEAQRQARFSGKHAPSIWFFFDEGDAIPKPVYDGAEACMSGGEIKQLILFNPRIKDGPVHRKQEAGQGVTVVLSAFRHPNVFTGKDLIPGAVSQSVTLRRINEWTRPLAPSESPDNACYKVPQCLEGKTTLDYAGKPYPPLPRGYRRIEEPAFYYMVLGKYPPVGENQLLNPEWVKAAIDRWKFWVATRGEVPPYGIRPVLSHDVAEMGSDKNVVTPKYGSWVARQHVWGKVEIPVSEDRVFELYQRLNAQWLNVDATGLGAGVAPHLQRRSIDAYGVKVAEKADPEQMTDAMKEMGDFPTIRDQMLWLMREWFRNDPQSMIPDDDELKDEILALTYAKDTKERVVICSSSVLREKLGRSPDKVMSLALLFAPRGRVKGKGRTATTSYIGR
jgi:uncharacterized protein YfiM (DUF2279 family)